MRRGCRLECPLAILVLCAAALPAAAQVRVLPPELAAQIDSLRADKEARGPAQRKVSSALLYAERLRRGLPVTARVASLRTQVAVAADGTTLLDVRARVSDDLIRTVAGLGGQVLDRRPAWRALRVRLPLDAVDTLAAHPDVIRIRPAARAITRTVVSEGDVAHGADVVRALQGVDGTGVAVGVLSDGVDHLTALEATGELPAVTVLPGQQGSGSEGTAMLEIVHDLAPGASLLFASAFGSQAGFAANIVSLRAAGADVIVDDVGYFAEAVFQDDDVAQAVNQVTADGALYFSAAGNAGSADAATSGVWEGDFAPSGSTLNGDPVHAFGSDPWDVVVVDSPYVFTLHWSDPLQASANDYDLYLVDPAANPPTVLAASTDTQDGTGDPFELIDSTSFDDTGLALVVVQYAGAGRTLHVNTNRGRLKWSTPGQTSGHAAARDAFGVAAVDVRTAGGAGGAFDGSESVESYSSDGPRRVFYEADGTPITPGNLTASGGEVRDKPDLAAADCVSTATPGFGVFCGTSAAAPHAAAVAALLLQLAGGPGGQAPALVHHALTSTALDIEAPGLDRDSGYGLAAAVPAAEAVLLPACSDGIDNDGDGLVDYGTGPGNDPGCALPQAPREDPQCQDGINNDPGQDGLIDFDGGASAGLPPAQQTAPDPQCSSAIDDREAAGTCGLGAELVVIAAALAQARRRLRARRRSG